MIRYSIITALCVLLAAVSYAQDPGYPDSIIVDTTYAWMNQNIVDVNIYAVTDDSITYYNIPLTWHSIDSRIYPVGIEYHPPLSLWDVTYDTIIYDEGRIRLLGWCNTIGDDNPPLLTNNVRRHCWTIHFHIEHLAYIQEVLIDTTSDPVSGPLLFELNGILDFSPAFVPGLIIYCILMENGETRAIMPDEILLLKNYPNPFNTSTTIEFTLPKETEIELSIYDLLGREVANLEKGLKPAGNYNFRFNAAGLSSGIYFCRLRAGDVLETKRMVLLK